MTPLVSVIITTYNRADLLNIAIRSVVDQIWKNLEIIVVDDGSSDDTRSIVDSFQDKRIVYIYKQNQGSPSISRNIGLRHSHGEFIAFLDDDDVWAPERIYNQLVFFNTHPEYGMVYSNAYSINYFGSITGLLRDPSLFREGKIFHSLIEWDYIPFLTIMLRKEVIDLYGFFNEDSNFLFVEDFELILRLSLFIKIGYLSEPLAYYRRSGENYSTRHDPVPGLLKIYSSIYLAYPQSRTKKMMKKIISLYFFLIKKAIDKRSYMNVLHWGCSATLFIFISIIKSCFSSDMMMRS